MKLPLIHYYNDGTICDEDEIFCQWESDTLNKINIGHTSDEGYLDIRSSVFAKSALEAFNIIADSLKEIQLVNDFLETIKIRIKFDANYFSKLSPNFDFSMQRTAVDAGYLWRFEITVNPQTHAHWNVKTIQYDHIYKREIQFGVCSNCGQHTHILSANCHKPKTTICPNCFAIMDE